MASRPVISQKDREAYAQNPLAWMKQQRESAETSTEEATWDAHIQALLDTMNETNGFESAIETRKAERDVSYILEEVRRKPSIAERIIESINKIAINIYKMFSRCIQSLFERIEYILLALIIMLHVYNFYFFSTTGLIVNLMGGAIIMIVSVFFYFNQKFRTEIFMVNIVFFAIAIFPFNIIIAPPESIFVVVRENVIENIGTTSPSSIVDAEQVSGKIIRYLYPLRDQVITFSPSDVSNDFTITQAEENIHYTLSITAHKQLAVVVGDRVIIRRKTSGELAINEPYLKGLLHSSETSPPTLEDVQRGIIQPSKVWRWVVTDVRVTKTLEIK